MPDDSFSLAIFDGPYAMQKAAWDRLQIEDLPEWYRPHLEDADRLLGASASLYFWNTSAGWAAVHPVILSMGWTFRSLVVWDKTVAHMAGRVDTNGLRTWFDISEVCGFYQREEWAPSTCAGQEIAQAIGSDSRNLTPAFYRAEREAAGMSKRDMARHFPSATGGLTGCVANWEGGLNYPTWEVWKRSAAAMTEHGPKRDRPYLVHPSVWPAGGLRASYDHLRASYDHLRASYDHLRAEYDHLRAEYESSRPAFRCPMGIGNVWTHLPVAGPRRLRNDDGGTLHPCQKPLAFADRMIRASSRPGESVWAPFGGTLREAVAAERIARADPNEARRVVTAELNQDGVDYIGPALRQMQGLSAQRPDPRQRSLFG
jgi:site-specific DNA-methyltransferase (adenine-specific)